MALFLRTCTVFYSDKYVGVPYAPIAIPKEASFKDMVALKGQVANSNINWVLGGYKK